MFRSSLLPEEWAAGYAGDLALMNGRRYGNELWRTLSEKLDVPSDRAGSYKSALLSRISGVSIERLVGDHTLAVHRNSRVIRHGEWQRPLTSNGWGRLGPLNLNQLRFCRSCAEEDLGFHGRAYFRRLHQIPGLCWCNKHDDEVLFKTPDYSHGASCSPDFWLKSGAVASALPIKRFRERTREFLRGYMAISESLMLGQVTISPQNVWRRGFEFAQASSTPVISKYPVRSPHGVANHGKLLSDHLEVLAPPGWLCTFVNGWVRKKTGVPDAGFDSGQLLTTSACAVVAAATFGKDLLQPKVTRNTNLKSSKRFAGQSVSVRNFNAGAPTRKRARSEAINPQQ